jgi:hypothetical protein
MAYNLLDYTGNAGLGAGSSGIDVGAAGANLNGLNKTLNDVMLLTADRNMKIFQQKVKDRDDLNQLIAQGQVAMGDIDPKDVPRFNAATQKVQDIYLKNPNILNDKKAYAEYQGAVREAQDIATHAQTRWKMLADLRQQKAKETLPWKQAAIQSHIDQQESKPFWDQIDPFQQLHDLNMDNITKRGVDPVTTTYNDPKDPLKSYSTTYFDYENIAKNKASDFMAQGEPAYDMIQFRDKILGLSQPEQAKFADNINGQIDKYNQSRGLIQGQQGFVDHIGQTVKDLQTGVTHMVITESAPELAAKVALASQGSFVTKTPLIKPEDQLKHQETEEEHGIERSRVGIEAQRLGIEATKLGLDKEKADAYVKHLKALDAKGGVDPKLDSNIKSKWGQIQNNVQFGAVTQKAKSGIFSSRPQIKEDITDVTNLPEDYQYLSGPVIDPKTHKVSVSRLLPFESEDGKQYYKNKYVNPSTGSDVDVYSSEWKDGYKKWQDGGYNGSYEDYLKKNLEQGAFELVLEGQFPQTDAKGEPIKGKYKTGRATYESFYNSERLINDEATRGKADVVEPPPE